MTDWTKVIRVLGEERVANFAAGFMSGNTFYRVATYTPVNGEVRNLLRTRGVNETRRLARKALTRRGYEFV